MTFNTTSLPLWHALQRKALLERVPSKRLGEPVRYILLDPQLDALLDGCLPGEFPHWSAERFISVFSANWRVTLSRRKTKRRPDVERLEGYDDVWVLCLRFRTIAPGWRILGRFYEKNVFVGFRAWDKRHLVSKYDFAAQQVIDDWVSLFGSQQPLRSSNIDDYLSQYEDLDHDPE